MSLLFAIGKGIARFASDKYADHQHKKAPKVAYQATGKKIEKARKRGKYINGSKTYKAELAKENARINAKHKRTDDFINDL